MAFDLAPYLFMTFAGLTIAAAISILLTKEIVRSALFLAFTFFGVAIVYMFLNAEFLSLIQILVYVGAINVLILFGVMLTKRKLMGGGPCE
ncbi:MAG: F(420)H(2) dehydrogenase subunit J [Methanomassiliicoccales archaeon PtaU1.Bin124]|nr:MAG: F(420)H(2) dehydrogenase subunit J [Methanomassiliicoccales archaeon PtaU1.Bin124]